MEYLELAAPPPLGALVRCFWFLRGDDLRADPQVIVPDGRLEIVLHLGDPFQRVEEEGGVRQCIPPSRRDAHSRRRLQIGLPASCSPMT
ncbi:MAG: DUF6597 domain-containing transcriptional factor [Gemmatimonadaceae bacterium]